MAKETIGDLTTDEFNQLIDNFIAREDDRIEPSTFLKAVAELERKRAVKEVELTGRMVNGDILYVGDTKVTLRLRAEGDEQAGAQTTTGAGVP